MSAKKMIVTATLFESTSHGALNHQVRKTFNEDDTLYEAYAWAMSKEDKSKNIFMKHIIIEREDT